MSLARSAFPLAILAFVALSSFAGAVHFYRGPGGGCTPADGALGDPPASSGATVLMMHNTFHDATTGTPVTIVSVGESVTWVWSSEHCHAALSTAFYTGFHYPADTPTTPALLPGLFHYPVPAIEPSLTYTHTFDAPGVYEYFCEHHVAIGMRGVVVVE